MKDFQSFDSGSSPGPRIELPRTRRSGHSVCIVRARRVIGVKDGNGMGLGLEEHPLKGPAHFHPPFGGWNGGCLTESFAGIRLRLNDDGLHLKM
jgi:hypothetical protein